MDALTRKVKEQGVKVCLKTKIGGITPQPDGCFHIQLDSAPGNGTPAQKQTEFFEQVLATISPQLLGRLVPTLPDTYLASLKQLKSMGAVVVILALKHQLTKQHYWINLPKGEGFPFLALVEHTNFIDRRHYDNDHIIYCGDYLKPEHEYFTLPKEELLNRFLPALARFNPNFDESWVKESWLFRTKYAQPVPPINHSINIPKLETPIPGLYWASMSQVYPWDRGTNYAVQIGRQAAQLIINKAKSGK